MPVKEEPVNAFQGYSIVKITETSSIGQLVNETYALTYASAGVIAEFALLDDAIQQLNRMLFPLPGLPTACA